MAKTKSIFKSWKASKSNSFSMVDSIGDTAILENGEFVSLKNIDKAIAFGSIEVDDNDVIHCEDEDNIFKRDDFVFFRTKKNEMNTTKDSLRKRMKKGK